MQQARDLAQQGQYEQAKALLKDLRHPKVAALIAQLDARLAARPTPKAASLPLRLMVSLAAGLSLLLIVGGVLLSQRSRPTEESPLPTAAATILAEDCTDATISAWWQAQIQSDRELNTFALNADAASSTMPGERLTAALETLRTTRASALRDVPTCANADLKQAVADVLSGMESVIAVLDRWNKGEISAGVLMTDYAAANDALHKAKRDVGTALP